MSAAEPQGNEIAIVGMACRAPGAPDLETFWRNLREGRESIRRLSPEELAQAGVPAPLAAQPAYVPAAGCLEGIDLFDAAYFGFSAREAQLLDPQHRLLLECAVAALESAGHAAGAQEPTIGVFAGTGASAYLRQHLSDLQRSGDAAAAYQASLLNEKDFLATRLSYKLDLRGPSVSVQSACSTSLVAVHLACQSLLAGDCDLALAGGVSLRLPQAGYLFQEGMILSPDGHCRAFDARAKGTVPGSGVGVVVLRRLSDALADGDVVHAVILGSAINNDGAAKIGFTAPSAASQAAVIAEALSVAGVSPDTIGYVEAHGTGTPLGDPIEIEALASAFRSTGERPEPCAVGSVKTNLGHLDAAAGVIGLIKAALMVREGELVPSLHFQEPNPALQLDRRPFRVAAAREPWRCAPGAPRRAGVSSFGIGGTNAHVVLEEAPPPRAEGLARIDRPIHLLALSARSPAALEQRLRDAREQLRANPSAALCDLCFSANAGRKHHEHRAAFAASEPREMADAIERRLSRRHGGSGAGARSGMETAAPQAGGAPSIAFLFSGQGAQHLGMGRSLYEAAPVFREVVDRCAAVLRGKVDLVGLIAGTGAEGAIDQTENTQPALFALEVGLAELWRSWGIVPEAVLGHSIGSFAAAAVAGVLELEDACRLVASRGRLMQALPARGAMAQVALSEAEALAAAEPRRDLVSLAAVNGAASAVLSGEERALAEILDRLAARGVACRRLRVSHAFHSPLMEAACAPFAAELAGVTLRAPRMRMVSDLTGEFGGAELADPGHWVRHIREPIRFADGVRALLRHGCTALVEIGPRATLLGLAAELCSESRGPPPLLLPSLRGAFEAGRAAGARPAASAGGSASPDLAPSAAESPAGPARADFAQLCESLAALYEAGAAVDFRGFDRPYPRRRAPLPPYPFQRRRYWLDAEPAQAPETAPAPIASTPPPPPVPAQPMKTEKPMTSPSNGHRDTSAELKRIVAELTGAPTSEVDAEANWFRLGLDSLMLVRLRQGIDRAFGVQIPMGHFYAETDTLAKAAGFVEAQDASAARAAARPAPAELPASIQVQSNTGAAPAPGPVLVPTGDSSFGDLRGPTATSPSPTSPTSSAHAHVNGHAFGRVHPGTNSRHLAPGEETQATSLRAAAASQVQPESASTATQLMQRQFEMLAQLAHQQLATLERLGSAPSAVALPAATHLEASAARAPAASPMAGPAPTAAAAPSAPMEQGAGSGAMPRQLSFFQKFDPDPLTARQRAFIEAFAGRYVPRTAGSRRLVADHRRCFSDWINAASFRFSLKEVLYPIVVRRSEGARLWDVDGNEYIDMAMGYGVNFLGHRPPYVVEALRRQLDDGFHLGPQNPLTFEAAELACELTGHERVTFTNTGTEAVMVAVRIARAVTGRRKIALFKGSYHGMFDGVLAHPGERGPEPAFIGTPQPMVDDLLLLDYGSDAALQLLRERGGEIAGVLAEPVQSRRPGFQPREYLQALRALTKEIGAALIFDEIITGFRVRPGGAQEHFGVRADIATYGKAMGGGLPIAIIAGSARFMDAIDGGMWRYGDDSVPTQRTTMFGGTFCKHPLAIAGARAALQYMKSQGPELQERVTRRAARLQDELNDFFQRERVPIAVKRFGSQFRFESFGRYDLLLNPIELELMFFLMMERGVYTWERRICFLSDRHTDADVDAIVRAVKESIAELRAGGFSFSTEDGSPSPTRGSGRNGGPRPGTFQGPAGPPVASASAGAGAGASEASTLPMSSAQRRLYALASLEGGEAPYHLTLPLLLEGTLDVAALERALNEVVQRHDALRTGFEVRGGEWVQRVHPAAPIALEVQQAPHDHLQELAQAAVRPFDLARPPLLRATLFRLPPRGERPRQLLVLDGHHIAADGLSWNVLLEELAALYGGGRLAPVPVQLGALLQRQQDELASGARAASLQFWRDLFGGGAPVLALPCDRPRPPKRSFSGDLLVFELDPELARELRALARARGVSLNMLLLGGFAVLLHRLSGQEDLAVGFPVAGREDEGAERVVGMLANTAVGRLRPRAADSFAAFLAQLKAHLLDVYAHARVPLEAILESLALAPDRSRNPLFDVSFVYESADGRKPRLGDLSVELVPPPRRVAMFDLTLEVQDEGGRLQASFEYATDLFGRETVERWADYLLRLLRSIARDPAAALGELEMAPAEELRPLRGGPALRPGTVVSDFEAQVHRTPDRVAVRCEGRALTYAELDRRAGRLARLLRARFGVGPEDRVGICLDRTEWLLVSILGVLKAGAAYVPVDIASPRARLRQILEQAAPKVVLADGARLELAGGFAEVVDVTAGEGDGGDAPLPEIEPTALAYVLFTSGSTGRPKGCAITHESLANYVRWANQHYFGDRDLGSLAVHTSSAFDFTVTCLFCPLLRGRAVTVYPAGLGVASTLEQMFAPGSGVDAVKLTPAHTTALAELGLTRTDVRVAIVGGEALTEAHLRALARLGPIEVYNEYGPTEATVGCIVARVDGGAGAVPIGRPIAGADVYLLDEHGRPVPKGADGEIHLGGACLARGYLGDPAQTAARFGPAPDGSGARIYRTGDRARLLADGQLEYLGRADDQVKIRGHRVELDEVARALLAQPGVRDAFPLARRASSGEQQLVAYLVGQDLDADRLRQGLRELLPEPMIPSVFVPVPALPLSEHGKVDRKALPDPDFAGLRPRARFEAPRGAIEEALAAAWQSVLGRGPIGIHDEYLALGGDSIKAIQIAARLLGQGLTLSAEDLFEHPTIAELAPRVRRALQAEEGSGALDAAPQRPAPSRPPAAVDGVEPAGSVAPSAAQRWFLAAHPAAHRNHFCQGVLLRARERVAAERLRAALEALAAHHAALRLRVVDEVEGSRLELAAAPCAPRLDVVEVPAGAAWEGEYARLSPAIDLARPPLLHAFLLRGGGEDRLVLYAHHLAVDALSWGTLVDDLGLAYEQASAGRSAELQPAGSFAAWTAAMSARAAGPELAAELAHWRRVASAPSLRPVPSAAPLPEAGLRGDAAVLTHRHGERATAALLDGAARTYGAGATAILLTALGRALAPRSGLRVLLETHGRSLSAGVDVGRTVGWFTAMFPHLVELPAEAADPREQVKHVDAALRAVPDGGAGYGLLRYGAGRVDLEPAEPPAVLLNYLGPALDPARAGAAFALERFDVPNAIHPAMPRPAPLELEGALIDGRLTWYLSYPSAMPAGEAEQILTAFAAEVERLLAPAALRSERAETPSEIADASSELTAAAAACGLATESVEDVFGLSPIQEGMLYHAAFDGRRQAHLEQFALTLEGRLDPGALRQAWELLFERHEILRAGFAARGTSRPLQVIVRGRKPLYEELDLSSLDALRRADAIERTRRALAERGFDLSRDVLMRLVLVRESETLHQLLCTFHHIILDGWAFGVLAGELFAAYARLRRGEAPALAAPPRFSRYVRWLESRERAPARAYWARALEGCAARSALPRRPDRAPGEGVAATLDFSLDAGETAALGRLASSMRTTASNVINAAWAVMLGAGEGAGDVVFGTVVSGRPPELPDIERGVGLYMNTVPVRVRMSGNESFAELARAVQRRSLESRPHETLPLPDILAAAEARSGLVDHLVVFENQPLGAAEELLAGTGLELRHVSSYERTSFDFSVEVAPGPCLGFRFIYDEGAFARQRVAELRDAFCVVLRGVIAEPTARVADLQRLTLGEGARREEEAFLASISRIDDPA